MPNFLTFLPERVPLSFPRFPTLPPLHPRWRFLLCLHHGLYSRLRVRGSACYNAGCRTPRGSPGQSPTTTKSCFLSPKLLFLLLPLSNLLKNTIYIPLTVPIAHPCLLPPITHVHPNNPKEWDPEGNNSFGLFGCTCVIGG